MGYQLNLTTIGLSLDDENTYWWTTEDNVEWKEMMVKYVLLYCKRY